MKKFLFYTITSGVLLSSCSKEDVLTDSSNETNSSMEMSIQQNDVIVERFSVFGEVYVASESFIDEHANYPDLANDNEITLYLLDESITENQWQIYVYEGDDVEYDFGLAFNYLYETGTVDGHPAVTCPKDGSNCAEATSSSGACMLIKKLEVDL